MAPQTINVLLTTFPGLGLPATLAIPVPASYTVGEVERVISDRLPATATNVNLTTTSNKLLSSRRAEPVTSLLNSPEDSFLPIRLSASLCGGKGGLGSQLRAAGGRMSSKNKRDKSAANGSNRTLGGNRIRDIEHAKNLAEYLALKPGMDQKEKDERRKRLEEIVNSTEAKQEEIKNGGRAARLDGKWVEAYEEASEKTRSAVLAALAAGDIKDVLGLRESDSSGSGSEASDDDERNKLTAEIKGDKVVKNAPRSFFGWDEDEDISDDSEEEDEEVEEEAEVVEPVQPVRATRSKGKAKA